MFKTLFLNLQKKKRKNLVADAEMCKKRCSYELFQSLCNYRGRLQDAVQEQFHDWLLM